MWKNKESQQGGEWLGPDSVRSCKTDEAGGWESLGKKQILPC